jgi:phosphoserine phosphatase RsbU/P
MTLATDSFAWLVPVSGPAIEPLKVVAATNGAIIGRHEQCDLRLPPDAHEVSRFHARFTFDADQWWLADMNSRWGTTVNGCAVRSAPPLSLSEADLIRIAPWTFTFTQAGPGRPDRLQSVDDGADFQTRVRTYTAVPQRKLAEDRLALLLESTAVIHAARSESELAGKVIEIACRGTGLQNAAVLRPLDSAGSIEIVAARMAGSAGSAPTYSRSLLAAASEGDVAELGAAGPASQSMVQMNIRSAICVPLTLESNTTGDRDARTVAAYLYLDSRGKDAGGLAPADSAFCVALGRMAGLALANLKRIDIERRQAALMAGISAAATAQRWILPQREVRIAPFVFTGESRPGAHVGGDFYAIVPLDAGRVAIALGDVTGHGVGASVLMATAQGFLHAALQEHGDPARAVVELNRFLEPRTPPGKFITLWIGLLDPQQGRITYVDAGHGYALLIEDQRRISRLSSGGGPPIGLFHAADYQPQTHPFQRGDALLIVSDGIIEQSGAPGSEATDRQFGVDSMIGLLKDPAHDHDRIAALFDAVARHAGAEPFADDATAVIVRWE